MIYVKNIEMNLKTTKMNSIEIKEYRLSGSKHCFIQTNGYLVDKLSTKYGRRIALKVFDDVAVDVEENMYQVKWGDDAVGEEPRRNTLLWEATQIQNIAALHGLAPRVYGLTTVVLCGTIHPVQIIEYIEGANPSSHEAAEAIYEKVQELGEKYGFSYHKRDVSMADVIDGKLIDFQTFAFTKDYRDTVREIYCESGKYGKVYYQDVPEIDLNGGPRKSELRIKELGLDQIDFSKKIVWDIGGAGGYFTRYALERGAKRVVGFDMEGPVNASRHMANYLGYFNADYEVVDLKDPNALSKFEKPDIAFFLSLNFHVPIPNVLADVPFIVFEDNGKETRHLTDPGKPWTDWFQTIEHKGQCTDHGQKSIYHLKK